MSPGGDHVGDDAEQEDGGAAADGDASCSPGQGGDGLAGAVAGLLFVAAQLATTPDVLDGPAARRLLLFVLPVGFIAGLTFDAVYSKLRTQDVADTTALTRR